MHLCVFWKFAEKWQNRFLLRFEMTKRQNGFGIIHFPPPKGGFGYKYSWTFSASWRETTIVYNNTSARVHIQQAPRPQNMCWRETLAGRKHDLWKTSTAQIWMKYPGQTHFRYARALRRSAAIGKDTISAITIRCARGTAIAFLSTNRVENSVPWLVVNYSQSGDGETVGECDRLLIMIQIVL